MSTSLTSSPDHLRALKRQHVRTAFALITLLSCNHFSTATYGQTDSSINGGTPFHAIRPGNEPMTYSQTMDSVFQDRLRITYAAVAGANSYALFSGTEFSLFIQNKAWIEQQAENRSQQRQLPPHPAAIPQLDSVVTALQIIGPDVILAQRDEEGTMPKPDSTSLPPKPEDRPAVVNQGGRILLNTSVNFSGWRKQPVKNRQAEKNSRTERSDAERVAVEAPPEPDSPPTGL